MRKLLIVDDEPIMREGLKCIIPWDDYGFTLCGECENGNEGLKKIIEYNPDLVLVDIKMPGMLGVEMVEEARKRGFTGMVIILTGYSNFDYAKKAINLDVAEYILKPIDEDELIDAVKKVSARLLSAPEIRDDITGNPARARSRILEDIMKGQPFQDNGDALLHSLGLITDLYQTAILTESPPITNAPERELWTGRIRNVLGKRDDMDVQSLGQTTVITALGSDAVAHFPLSLSDLKKTVSPRSVFAGIGRPVNRLMGIHTSYQDAAKVINCRFCCKRDIIAWDTIKDEIGSGDIQSIDFDTYIDKLYTCLEIEDLANLRNRLQEIEELFHYMDSPKKIMGIYIHLFITIKERVLAHYGEAAEGLPQDKDIIQDICEKENLNSITEYLYGHFYRISHALSHVSGDTIVQKMLHYINTHFAQNLKLQNLAELFGYNSAYLGKLFKSSTGTNFNHYLDTTRIENAKRLLAKENLKVYQIAEQVGYKNIDYFYRKFKMLVDMSPREYASQCRQNK